MTEFKDRVALITGAGRGIGRAVALAFAARGARVAVQDISPVNLDETAAQIAAEGSHVQDYVFDLAKKMPVQALIEAVRDDFGSIDFLVNCASITPKGAILAMDEWDWLRTLDVNLNGVFFLLQSLGRVMRDQGGGAIVNVAAPTGPDGRPGQGAVVASMYALAGLTRAAAAEFAPFHVRINTVVPGGMQDSLSTQAEAPGRIPLGRPGRPEDVAPMVLFLCSQAAGYLTGQIITIDGGQSVQ